MLQSDRDDQRQICIVPLLFLRSFQTIEGQTSGCMKNLITPTEPPRPIHQWNRGNVSFFSLIVDFLQNLVFDNLAACKQFGCNS